MPNSLRFTLTASDGSNILLIGAPASANKLILTLTNVYESSVIIQHVQPGSTTQNFTLSESAVLLYFNGLMSNDVVAGITLSESNGWVLRSFFDQQAGQYLALVAQNDIVLEPNDSLTILLDMPVISATTAEGYFTARYLNVLAGATESASQLLYMSLRYPPRSSGGSAAAVLPLQAEFVGSNVIYNDGRPTTLKLRLTNTDADPLQPGGSRNPQPLFRLSFVQFTAGSSSVTYPPGVLLETSDAGAVGINITADQLYGNELTVTQDPGTSPQSWKICEEDTSAGYVLGTGAAANVELTISNLKTRMPAGVTSAIIAYYNFSGYPDGQVVAEIEVRNPPVLLPEITVFTAVNSSINIIHTGSQEFIYSINNATKAEFYVNGLLVSTSNQNFNGADYITYLTINATSVCMLVASNSDNMKVSQSIVVTVDTVPIGAIMMWSGLKDTVPDGWLICDGRSIPGGTNTTPNLSSRFIYAADPDSEGKTNIETIGHQGGSNSHTHSLTTISLPITISGGHHQHYINFASTTKVQATSSSGSNDFYHARSDNNNSTEWTGTNEDISLDGAHSHTASTPSHTHTVVSDTNNSMPAFYALYYIMKYI